MAPRARIHVVTFATPEYANSAEVLRHSAVLNGNADTFRIYTPHDDCVERFLGASGLDGRERAFGFWGWKPAIIDDALHRPEVREGDVVLYLDTAIMVESDLGASLKTSDEAWSTKLFSLGEAAAKGYTNGRWTRPAALDLLGATDAERSAFQVNAAVQAYRKCETSERFVAEYRAWCENADVLRDEPGFPDHRHDQSVVSVMAERYASLVTLCRDPTQYGVRDPALHGSDGEPWLDHHRRRIGRIPTVAVITPTIGSEYLEEAVRSVALQSVPGVQHWIVVDGPEHERAVDAAIAGWEAKTNIRVVRLPQNVGAGGWNGHRVYGSVPWIADTTHVAFLDEDNFWDQDHLESLLGAMRATKAPWAFTLRRVVRPDGSFACEDRCESLGLIHHTVCGKGDYLVDTNCYLVDRDLAIRTSPVWNARFRDDRPNRPEPDRALCVALASAAPFAAVRRSTVSYRLGGSERSVQGGFFEAGNRALGLELWKPDVYVFHFNEAATARFFESRTKEDRSYALDEWQPSTPRGLGGGFNLMDGYANVVSIPQGSTVLVNMCLPHEMPLEFLAARTDVRRVGYTLESPNIRHAEQWSSAFLKKHFDVLLTYWEPLLAGGAIPAVFCPHNTHHLDLENPLDRGVLRRNAGTGGDVCMVLEHRPGLRGEFDIDGTKLTCLDPKRGELVEKLRDVTVVGRGWDTYTKNPSGLKVANSASKAGDTKHAIDWYSEHTFALVIENVDAEGYVSEKLYDALIAGAIPLYWGNVSARLLEHAPELAGLYVDIKGKTSEEVRAIVDGFSAEDVEEFRGRIYARREAVLAKVGVKEFARIFESACDAK